MPALPRYQHYVTKMRGFIAAGKDLATEARFVDMILLMLQNRFADWHLAPYRERSQWSVSVYLAVGTRADPTSSDGIFVLDR